MTDQPETTWECLHAEEHGTQAECDAFDAIAAAKFDLEQVSLERDDWRRNAEFAGEKLQESVQRFAQASAAQLQAQIDLHELQQKVARLRQHYEGERYASVRSGDKPASFGMFADALGDLLGDAR